MKIVVGDKKTLMNLFWDSYETLELRNRYFVKWMFPVLDAFHNETTCLMDALKIDFKCAGMEGFIDDCGFSEIQTKRS